MPANILITSKPAKFQILKMEDTVKGHNNGRLKKGNITKNKNLKPFGLKEFTS